MKNFNQFKKNFSYSFFILKYKFLLIFLFIIIKIICNELICLGDEFYSISFGGCRSKNKFFLKY